MSSAIIADQLTYAFGAKIAVEGLAFAIEAGEIFAFVGHNGAGKTTTVRLLNGLLIPAAGSARVLEMDPTTQGINVRRRTGVLTETPSLDDRLTARETLATFGRIYGVAEISRQSDAVLRQFGLAERADDRVGSYSAGMKQRLALARALMHDPEILFLDEPTASLDPVAARQLHELIAHLSRERGRTILLCTHNLTEAQALCDRVAIVGHGKLLALGAPRELAARYLPAQRLGIEIEAGQAEGARQAVAAWSATAVSEWDGATLKVSGVERGAVPGLIAALVGAGVAIYAVHAEAPTLEDVYFALHPAETSRSG